MNKKLITGAAGVVLALCVGLGVALPAQADTIETASTAETASTVTATAAASDSAAETNADGEHAHRGHARNLDAAELAAKLDLTEAELSDALATVRENATNSDRPERLGSDATKDDRTAARDARQATFVSSLAAELDVSEDAVDAALTELRADHEDEREANREARNGDRADRGGFFGDRGQSEN